MARSAKRYKKMELYMSIALITEALLFLLYLIIAGAGVIWLKTVLSIIIFLISIACLAFLYLSKEMFHHRSLWMSTAAVAIAICLLASLVLNFPCPSPYA